MRILSNSMFGCFLLMATSFLLCQCLPTDDELKSQSRVHETKLSDQEHYTDHNHDNKLEHNDDYDHEAFLGKEEASQFKSLTPEESRARLGPIIAKIDRNHDSYVSEYELRNWIRLQHRLYLLKDSEKKWAKLNSNGDENLTFDELIDNTIGGPDTWTEQEKEERKDNYKTYLKLMERDKRRFKAADSDGDGKLTKKEYADFLHPEEAPVMRDVVIQETMEDLDKDGDGVVNVDEFISDIYPSGISANGQEPEWVQAEREQYKSHRDKNGDGVLDREEVANWILPPDHDHTLSEAKHLIYEADENKDGKLSKDEILNNYSVFVASQATSYGEAIYNREDL